MPSLVGKNIAIFTKDPKNFNTGEIISGKVIDGMPSSPEYSILEADETIRNLFYTSIQEIRVLSEQRLILNNQDNERLRTGVEIFKTTTDSNYKKTANADISGFN